MIRFNELGTSLNEYLRCSSGAPDLSGGNFLFAMWGAMPSRNVANGLFCVMPSAGTDAPFMVTTLATTGNVRVLMVNASVFHDTALNFAGITGGVTEPFLLVARATSAAGTTTLEVQSRRIGQGSKNSGSDAGLITIPASSGEWGIGTMSSTPTFYTNSVFGGWYSGPVRFSTYTAGNVPAISTVFDSLWLDYESILDSSVFGTPVGSWFFGSGWCPNSFGSNTPAALEDVFATTSGANTLIRNIVSNPTQAWYQTNSSPTAMGMSFSGQHKYVNPYTTFPDSIVKATSTYGTALSGAQQYKQATGVMAELLQNKFSRARKIAVTGQSWQAGFRSTGAVVVDASRKSSGTLLAQAMLIAAGEKAIGVLFDPEFVDTSSAFWNANGWRIGYRFTAEFLQSNGENSASSWPSRFSTGYDNGVAIGRQTSSGGAAWVGTGTAGEEYTDAAFDPTSLDGIDSTDTLLLGRVVLRYPGGSPTVNYTGSNSATIAGANTATYSGGTIDCDSSIGLLTTDSVTGGTISSGANTSPDIIVCTGTQLPDYTASDPDDPNSVIMGARDVNTGEVCVISSMTYNGGTGETTINFNEGWTALPALGIDLDIGPIELVRVEIGGIAASNYGRIRVTKPAAAGGGPLIVVGRYGWAENKAGAIIGGIGTGGTAYSLWGDRTFAGFPNRIAAVMEADGCVICNTATTQAENEEQIVRMRKVTPNLFGYFVSAWCSANDSYVDLGANNTTREAFRAAFVAEDVAYYDGVDDLGRTSAQIIAGDRSDGTHFSTKGYYEMWLAAQSGMAASSGSNSFRDRGRGRLLMDVR